MERFIRADRSRDRRPLLNLGIVCRYAGDPGVNVSNMGSSKSARVPVQPCPGPIGAFGGGRRGDCGALLAAAGVGLEGPAGAAQGIPVGAVVHAAAVWIPAAGYAAALRGEGVMWWEVAPRGVTGERGTVEARSACVIGFCAAGPSESGVLVVIGFDRRVGSRHLIDEAGLIAPGRRAPAGHQGQGAGALLWWPVLGRCEALREAFDRESALCVAEVDAGAETT
mmetsp:Transcript_58845/g.133207  ORF Transcript_58845/g.133207 Transcript_58845/m.133207 type:complete len:224 (-) Transcript_58845:1759-2430(-)